MIEQYQDIIENCTHYLTALEKIYVESNDTPEGRMISQLKWLKQEAVGERLALPVDPEYTGTLGHVSVEHKSIMAKATPKWEIYHYRLLNLVKGRLLAKPEHNNTVYPLLSYLLTNIPKKDKLYRPKLVELEALILSNTNQYPINSDIFHPTLTIDIYESTEIKAFPEGIQTMEMISEYCFEGVRDLENSPYIECQCQGVHKPTIAKH